MPPPEAASSREEEGGQQQWYRCSSSLSASAGSCGAGSWSPVPGLVLESGLSAARWDSAARLSEATK